MCFLSTPVLCLSLKDITSLAKRTILNVLRKEGSIFFPTLAVPRLGDADSSVRFVDIYPLDSVIHLLDNCALDFTVHVNFSI